MNEHLNFADKHNISDLVHQIVFLISSREDYKSAAKIMKENNISLEELTNQTFKLGSRQLGHLADNIIDFK